MKKPTLALATVALLVAAVGSLRFTNVAADEATPVGLPGAKPVIDAARFPTLQAAFDAIPVEGASSNCRPGRSRSQSRSSSPGARCSSVGKGQRRTS